MWKCFCNVLLLCVCCVPSTFSANSSVTGRSLPRCLFLGTELSKPIYYLYKEDRGSWYQFHLMAGYPNWLPSITYGRGTSCWQDKRLNPLQRAKYTSEGQFFRIGLDYNFIKDTPKENAAFLGLRYVNCFFSDRLRGTLGEGSKNTPVESTQTDVHARWIEAAAGVKMQLYRMLYVGSTAFYKFGLRITRADQHVPYYVLGWGRNNNDSSKWGMDFYLSLRIPLGQRSVINRHEKA